MTPNKVVALAMPFRCKSGDPEATALGVRCKATIAGKIDVVPGMCWTSLLPYTFNLLWSGFLNQRKGVAVPQVDGSMVDRPIDYFAMIHDDIKPDAGWLDTLIGILEDNDADVVSAVIPIKDHFGLTSTAVDDGNDEWNPRRLTMTEVCELPETFGSEEAGGPLCVNTGLWVCRFDRDWCEKVYFRQGDRIITKPDGTFEAYSKPEDWDFSRQVRSFGGKILATRKVGLAHERDQWTNRRPWGQWKTDMLKVKDLAETKAVPAETASVALKEAAAA